jgi:hypothetical protein
MGLCQRSDQRTRAQVRQTSANFASSSLPGMCLCQSAQWRADRGPELPSNPAISLKPARFLSWYEICHAPHRGHSRTKTAKKARAARDALRKCEVPASQTHLKKGHAMQNLSNLENLAVRLARLEKQSRLLKTALLAFALLAAMALLMGS